MILLGKRLFRSIFLHTGILIFSGTGDWGVSIFFMLSGFLLIIHIKIRQLITKNPFLHYLVQLIRKLANFIFCILLQCFLCYRFLFVVEGQFTISQTITAILLNGFLLQ